MNAIQKEVFRLFNIGDSPYSKFPRVKKKKNGKKKVRWIYAPNSALKKQQKEILQAVLYRYASHPCAHAYVAQKNIRSGASQHIHKAYTIVVDIKNFFPSITKEMIRKALSFYTQGFSQEEQTKFFIWNEKAEELLRAPETHELPEDVTSLDILIELCTYEGVIPQGAPTSGALSNILLYPLDCLLEQVSEENDIVYTRYADDLSFSGDNLEKLKSLVFGYFFKKLELEGFTINKSKVHVLQGQHRFITGLNVHAQGVRPNRKYRRKLRARLARLRNLVSKCSSADELYPILVKNRFFHGEIGHYWYVLYADTYSNSVEKLAVDYFYPIMEKIREFFPSFGQNARSSSLRSSSLRKELEQYSFKYPRFAPEMIVLSREIKKMFISGYDINAITKRIGKGRISHLDVLVQDEYLTHREKRELIKYSLQRDTPTTWGRILTAPLFRTLHRMVLPEDKIALLLRVIEAKPYQRGIWYKLAEYGSRCSYTERITLLRAISEQKVLFVGVDAERFALRKAIRKILRGIPVAELSEFLTSAHENLRIATQDFLAYKIEN